MVLNVLIMYKIIVLIYLDVYALVGHVDLT